MEQEQEQEQESQPMNINNYQEQEAQESEAGLATGGAAEEIENAVDPVYTNNSRVSNQSEGLTESRPLANMNMNESVSAEPSYNAATGQIMYGNTKNMTRENLAGVYHNFFRNGQISGRKRKTQKRKNRKTQKRKARKQRKTRTK
jgi:hypothetical protein